MAARCAVQGIGRRIRFAAVCVVAVAIGERRSAGRQATDAGLAYWGLARHGRARVPACSAVVRVSVGEHFAAIRRLDVAICILCAAKFEDGRLVLAMALYKAKKDYPRALTHLEGGCKDKDLKLRGYACNAAGAILAEGKGMKKDPAHALAFFESACEIDDKQGCSNAGLSFVPPRPVAAAHEPRAGRSSAPGQPRSRRSSTILSRSWRLYTSVHRASIAGRRRPERCAAAGSVEARDRHRPSRTRTGGDRGRESRRSCNAKHPPRSGLVQSLDLRSRCPLPRRCNLLQPFRACTSPFAVVEPMVRHAAH
jgi:hypothetical protein